MSDSKLTKRDFIRNAGLAAAGTVGAATLSTPHIVRAQTPIRWRLQTYAGPALAEHVIKPAIDTFNKALAAGLSTSGPYLIEAVL